MKGMKPAADNPAMVMDLYELTMANGYFLDPDVKNTKVAFDVFFRRIPDGGGFAVFAGLEQIIEYITNLHFDKDDVDYLRSLNLYSDEFLNYLETFRFHGDVYAFEEGSVMYPNEPVITVVADLVQAQIVETAKPSVLSTRLTGVSFPTSGPVVPITMTLRSSVPVPALSVVCREPRLFFPVRNSASR